jgi:predicted nucleic acid-binding protein
VIFVDTSFFFASLEPKDRLHAQALSLLSRVAQQDLVTTNNVRGETWTLIRSRSGHRAAVRFLDSIRRSQVIRVEHVGRELEDDALNWLRGHDERAYSFVDATSFAFMEANGITDALTFDGDFAAAGFIELRP